jgi:predicted transglutaminase-like cysteine proteinase
MKGLLALLCLALLPTLAEAQSTGLKSFCDRLPRECEVDEHPAGPFNASPEQLKQLEEVNFLVNIKVEPTTDMELYGVSDFWVLPTDKGDCEDYALLKRHDLIAMGWPVAALLLTAVRDADGEMHMVLTARTTSGDFILDNKSDELLPADARGAYTFVARQAAWDPQMWERFAAPPQPQRPSLWAVLACFVFTLIGIGTVARRLAIIVGYGFGVRSPAQRRWEEECARIDDYYRKHYEADALSQQTADICVEALERALDAMKDDPKLAKREIEVVIEEIEGKVA